MESPHRLIDVLQTTEPEGLDPGNHCCYGFPLWLCHKRAALIRQQVRVEVEDVVGKDKEVRGKGHYDQFSIVLFSVKTGTPMSLKSLSSVTNFNRSLLQISAITWSLKSD